jgi:phage shock protein PspC (stress-responsive transcriptional regulator)
MSSPGQGSRAPAGADVGATLRDMWATRPARLKEDRKVAGVAAAIARRYAIDPTLVRVGFVVSLFYGVGLLVYLAGILVLPRVDATGRRETPVWAIVIGAILGIGAIASAFSGDLGTVIGVVVAVTLLYLLHHSRAHLRDPQRPTAVAEGTGGPGGTGETASPPSWDPLGAAPFAWDLPEPAAPPAPKPPRSKVVPVTLAVAVLATGLVAGLGLLGLVPLGVTALVGTALAVIGAGLVVGAFLHRGRGLLVAAVPLALVLIAAANGAGDGPWRDGGPPWADDAVDGRPGSSQTLGDANWAPAAGAIAPVYETAWGDARLDLRGIGVGPPVRTEVRSGAGDVTVLVPATADVTATCESGGGDADCLGLGAGPLTDLGPDGPGGPVIDLQAASGGGDVEVRRG